MKNKQKMWRYERKFLVPELDIHEVRHLVKLHPSLFSVAYPKRLVNNIYLDSQDFSNYHENVGGNAQRLKIRIRWYGKTFGRIERPVLELKIKSAELGRKLSYPLHSFTLNKRFTMHTLREVFKNSRLPKNVRQMLVQCKPALLNSYEREYFEAGVSDKIRLTLDYHLVFYPLREYKNSFSPKTFESDRVILEVKYPQCQDNQASLVTNAFPFRLSASSKYVYGIDVLAL